MVHIKGLTYFCHDILRLQCGMVNGAECFQVMWVVCTRGCSVVWVGYWKDTKTTFVQVLCEWPRYIGTVRARTQCKSIYCANEVGKHISVCIATYYGLDGPGSNPFGGDIFRTRSDQPRVPPSLLYNEYRVFLGGKLSGPSVDHLPHLATRLKKE
jgi:hypothetical protein